MKRRFVFLCPLLRPYDGSYHSTWILSDDQKIKWKKFGNCARTNFRKEDTMRILFSDEKFFDLDGIYNSQNDLMWAVNRADADKKGGI